MIFIQKRTKRYEALSPAVSSSCITQQLSNRQFARGTTQRTTDQLYLRICPFMTQRDEIGRFLERRVLNICQTQRSGADGEKLSNEHERTVLVASSSVEGRS